MLLRRFMSHVSNQNWFAVALDFLIVVLGVAVGFQLTGYYDETRRRSSEAAYLAGIATDYAIYQQLLICRVEGETVIATALSSLIREIEGEPISTAERAALIQAASMSHVVQTGLAMEGNTSALVGGDLVATISDTRLRGLILAAQSIGTATIGTTRQIEAAYNAIPRFDRFTTRRWHEGIGYYLVTDYDIGAMRAAPSLRDDLMNLVNLHRATAATNRGLLDAVEGVLDRLVELGSREAPQSPARCPYANIGAPPQT